jgi:hypothetical protein
MPPQSEVRGSLTKPRKRRGLVLRPGKWLLNLHASISGYNLNNSSTTHFIHSCNSR